MYYLMEKEVKSCINRKYIVSLIDNNWRTVYKNKWYKHKKDLSDFINNYILKDFPNEINT